MPQHHETVLQYWMTSLRRPVILRLLVVACVTIMLTSSANARDVVDELAEIHEIAILVSPPLAEAETDAEKALLLRDQVHRAGISGGLPALTTADLSDWGRAYRLSILQRTRSNSCNGKAILYMLALRAFGIPSRIVTLYAASQSSFPVWSHASVDVRIDGKWIAMDPTFNISLKDGAGAWLSWKEAVLRLRRGEFVHPYGDGKKALRGQSWDDYRERAGGNLAYLSAYALLGPWEGGPAKSLNPGWDGKIHYIDGSTFDAWASISGSFYRAIAGVPD